LATGGSGDVLSGVIGALLARGLNPYDASCLAAYVHGLAGEQLELENRGVYGVIASDISQRSSAILNELSAGSFIECLPGKPFTALRNMA
jgi:NAD(P)H-hydrate epimerase